MNCGVVVAVLTVPGRNETIFVSENDDVTSFFDTKNVDAVKHSST